MSDKRLVGAAVRWMAPWVWVVAVAVGLGGVALAQDAGVGKAGTQPAATQPAESPEAFGRRLVEQAEAYLKEGRITLAVLTAQRAVGFGAGEGIPEADAKGYAAMGSEARRRAEAILGKGTFGLPIWSSPAALHHESYMPCVAYSPDGRTIASASRDETIRLWDVASGDCIAVLEGHEGTVYSVAFSPDGRTLASASGDRTIRLWDVSGTYRGQLDLRRLCPWLRFDGVETHFSPPRNLYRSYCFDLRAANPPHPSRTPTTAPASPATQPATQPAN